MTTFYGINGSVYMPLSEEDLQGGKWEGIACTETFTLTDEEFYMILDELENNKLDGD